MASAALLGQRKIYHHHIKCEDSRLATLPVRSVGWGAQGHSCHLGAELNLPQKRKRVSELDRDLKVEIFPVPCNYEEFLSNTQEYQ